MTGHGRDGIGPFYILGTYSETSGQARWLKKYVGRHAVAYQAAITSGVLRGQWRLPRFKLSQSEPPYLIQDGFEAGEFQLTAVQDPHGHT